jgi:hypothetical protein
MIMRSRFVLGGIGMILSFSLAVAVISAQEPQRAQPQGDTSGQIEKKAPDDRPFLERTIRQIEEQTKRRIEQLEQEKEKIQAQTRKRLEELDAQAQDAATKARMRIQQLRTNLKQRLDGFEITPARSPALPSSVDEKLDKILERLNTLERRLDRLEKEPPKRTAETPSKIQ